MTVSSDRKGRFGEWLAAQMLRLFGFRILYQRYKTPVGEIDIIARKRNLLVFVEVKVRKTDHEAGEALGKKQRGRIVRAARYFLASDPEAPFLECRFDYILFRGSRWPQWIKGAFQED